MKNKKEEKQNNKNKGALLFELLIVISLLAVILSVGANAVFLSMRSNQISGERDVATGLAAETLEAVRAVIEEDWNLVYKDITKGAHYYPSISNGKWVLTATGDETVNINNATYTRYVVVENVSRDNTSRSIQGIYSSSSEDPSTQKVTATVTWTGGNPITITEYFFRWKNKTCNQTAWTGGKTFPSDPVPSSDCSLSTTYYNDDGHIDNAGGSIKLK